MKGSVTQRARPVEKSLGDESKPIGNPKKEEEPT